MSFGAFMLMMGGATIGATAAPTSASAGITGAGTATSGSVTLTPRGGSGNFSVSWSTPSFTATSPSSLSTTFSKSLTSGQHFSGTATWTLTDTATGQTATGTVSVALDSTPPPLTLSLNPTNHTFTRVGAGTITAIIDITVTAGGVGPYTVSFLWQADDGVAQQSGSSGGLSSPITNPFAIAMGSAPATRPGTYNVTVTDETNGAVGTASTRVTGQST